MVGRRVGRGGGADVLVFAPYARFIPRAALAGILICTAWKMIDWKRSLYHVRATRFDSAIVWATAFSARRHLDRVLRPDRRLHVVPAHGAAGRSHAAHRVHGYTRRRDPRAPARRRAVQPHADVRARRRDVLRRIAALERHFDRIEKQMDTHTRFVVLRLDGARNADAIGIGLLKSFVDRARAGGVQVLLCGVRPGLAKKLARTKLGNSGEKFSASTRDQPPALFSRFATHVS